MTIWVLARPPWLKMVEFGDLVGIDIAPLSKKWLLMWKIKINCMNTNFSSHFWAKINLKICSKLPFGCISIDSTRNIKQINAILFKICVEKNWPAASEKIEKNFHCTVQSIKYLMKVDDDSYINLRRLSEYVTIIDKRCSQKCIVGHVLGPNSPVIRPKFVQGFITQPKLIWYQLSYYFCLTLRKFFPHSEFLNNSWRNLWLSIFLSLAIC